MKWVLLLIPFLISCDSNTNHFLNITDYNIGGEYIISPGGIKIYPNSNNVDGNLIDKKVDELENCLQVSIDRKSFSVYIPDDWYVSSCSGEQLIPSLVDPKLCEDKGIEIEEECKWVKYPTEECPCPCNIRSGIQDDTVVITTPNLKLFKMPLTRIIIYPEYAFVEKYEECMW